jgi:O-acetyl-ADP-ribose deacetylase (regulator of RNase III)
LKDGARENTNMAHIEYIKGDATCPQAKGMKIIAHICNDCGGWGKGFVVAISRRWPEPEQAYREWHRNRNQNDFGLGGVQFVQAEEYIWIANMAGQHGMTNRAGKPLIRYEAVGQCLEKVGAKALELEASVHMPRIGCGLAGGKWELIEPLIKKMLCEKDVPVTVYDF